MDIENHAHLTFATVLLVSGAVEDPDALTDLLVTQRGVSKLQASLIVALAVVSVMPPSVLARHRPEIDALLKAIKEHKATDARVQAFLAETPTAPGIH